MYESYRIIDSSIAWRALWFRGRLVTNMTSGVYQTCETVSCGLGSRIAELMTSGRVSYASAAWNTSTYCGSLCTSWADGYNVLLKSSSCSGCIGSVKDCVPAWLVSAVTTRQLSPKHQNILVASQPVEKQWVRMRCGSDIHGQARIASSYRVSMGLTWLRQKELVSESMLACLGLRCRAIACRMSGSAWKMGAKTGCSMAVVAVSIHRE